MYLFHLFIFYFLLNRSDRATPKLCDGAVELAYRHALVCYTADHARFMWL